MSSIEFIVTAPRTRRRRGVISSREPLTTPKTAWDVRLSFHQHNSQTTIEALLPSGRRPRAEDAKLRDRSAPDVCPIAILRGLLL